MGGPVSGLRHLAGTRLALAVSVDNKFDVSDFRFEDRVFDPPPGYFWASMAEWEREVRNCTDDGCAFAGRDGWVDCTWNGKRRVLFAFRDSARTGRWQHARGKPTAELDRYGMAEIRKNLPSGFAGLALVMCERSSRIL
eukprot:NODE_5257_length_598_cov_153.920810.p1 GENE.NODE_5257_length_598_cov_153.920810~~NODE_5257_length_598_cov_153.920810.p1  ORF type:complete len:139 (+),score=45.92 NODE_5257_length_598_cov_153.920810:29-445(+)